MERGQSKKFVRIFTLTPQSSSFPRNPYNKTRYPHNTHTIILLESSARNSARVVIRRKPVAVRSRRRPMVFAERSNNNGETTRLCKMTVPYDLTNGKRKLGEHELAGYFDSLSAISRYIRMYIGQTPLASGTCFVRHVHRRTGACHEPPQLHRSRQHHRQGAPQGMRHPGPCRCDPAWSGRSPLPHRFGGPCKSRIAILDRASHIGSQGRHRSAARQGDGKHHRRDQQRLVGQRLIAE